jgi:beta-glucosidase
LTSAIGGYRLPPRSELHRLLAPDAFVWATGIEDTFITAPWPATGRTLDEYALTDHYARWREDLDLMASLGVGAARYGVPWHKVNPAPGAWEWSWADEPLERLLELGIDPIVDLVHYGTPPWIEDAFLNPDYPQRVAEYAARLAERFRGRIRWYTPLNEPRITAWYCGRLGWWPPFKRGWRGFVSVMLGVCRGIVATAHALHGVDPEIVLAHVDATDLYLAPPDDRALQDEAARRQEIVFLALDLVAGRVTEEHALWEWVQRQGATQEALDHFQERPVGLDVVGINLYPMFSEKHLIRTASGTRIRMRYALGEITNRLATLYWERHRRPVFVTETAARKAGRAKWLADSVAACVRAREAGIPVIGYTWWPMFALVAWAYRQGSRDPAAYLEQMGLWDLDSTPENNLARRPTPMVEAYRALISMGAPGSLRSTFSHDNRYGDAPRGAAFRR